MLELKPPLSSSFFWFFIFKTVFLCRTHCRVTHCVGEPVLELSSVDHVLCGLELTDSPAILLSPEIEGMYHYFPALFYILNRQQYVLSVKTQVLTDVLGRNCLIMLLKMPMSCQIME